MAGYFSYQDFISSIDGLKEDYSADIDEKNFFGFPLAPILKAEEGLLSGKVKSIAYFSMEYGIAPSIYNAFSRRQPTSDKNKISKHEVFSNYWLCDYLFKIEIDAILDIPIYGGGLGVLAGDTMKSCADLGLSVAGIGLLWNKGYFRQRFWYKQGQIPEELSWDPKSYPGLIPLRQVVTLTTKQGPLYLQLWKYYVYSYDKKNACPIILLDSHLPENDERFRKLTDQLYRSDSPWWKIFQRSILGMGGIKALECLGYKIDRYHLNEGHAAFALLEKFISLNDKSKMADFKKRFVYTCHTPVAAGHDRFKIHDVYDILEPGYVQAAEILGKENPSSDEINLTFMALEHCQKVNAVSLKHGEVMQLQFPRYANKMNAITNGVHMHTWLSDSFCQLFDAYKDKIGHWRSNPACLEKVTVLSKNKGFRLKLFEAHQKNKRHLIELVKHWQVKEHIFTLGWARRIAAYKRPALIFHHIPSLVRLARDIGPIQIILAGKAHPNDNLGAAKIDEILNHIDELNNYKDIIRVLILENYDTYFAKLLTSSVDVWLNNPLPPFEASGTSGMKAIINGVLQVSTVDGWIAEAAEDNIGWFFGYQHDGQGIGHEGEWRLDEDSQALYKVLEEVIGLYYQTYRDGKINVESPWIDKMIQCIKKGAYFNTHRMVKEYQREVWQ